MVAGMTAGSVAMVGVAVLLAAAPTADAIPSDAAPLPALPADVLLPDDPAVLLPDDDSAVLWLWWWPDRPDAEWSALLDALRPMRLPGGPTAARPSTTTLPVAAADSPPANGRWFHYATAAGAPVGLLAVVLVPLMVYLHRRTDRQLEVLTAGVAKVTDDVGDVRERVSAIEAALPARISNRLPNR